MVSGGGQGEVRVVIGLSVRISEGQGTPNRKITQGKGPCEHDFERLRCSPKSLKTLFFTQLIRALKVNSQAWNDTWIVRPRSLRTLIFFNSGHVVLDKTGLTCMFCKVSGSYIDPYTICTYYNSPSTMLNINFLRWAASTCKSVQFCLRRHVQNKKKLKSGFFEQFSSYVSLLLF